MKPEPKECVVLLAVEQKNVGVNKANGSVGQSTSAEGSDSSAPPDGGIRAFSVLIASFLVNGLIFGIINSYSVIYTVLLYRLEEENVSSADVKASLVGALTIGTMFFMSSVSGVLAGILGLRTTAIIGGFLAATGLILSSFVVNHVYALCFTYGILFGLGTSLVYTPSLAILGQYFKNYLGIVNGVVTIGSSAFTVFMPDLMEWMIKNHSLEWMFRLLAVFASCLILCGLMFKPFLLPVVNNTLKEKDSLKSWLKKITRIQMWKIQTYRMWAISMPIALFGYFVPYVHIKKFIKDLHFHDVNENLPIQCIAITSAIGRLFFGYLSDRKWTNRILLQQISFYVIGTLTIILPFVQTFGFIVAIALGIGLFEGGFIALIGPVAFELVGCEHATQAIGCMLGLAALPLSIGPPIAGALYNHYRSYTLPFILAGISPIVGATLMFRISLKRCSKDPTPDVQSNSHVLPGTQNDVEKTPRPLLAVKDRVIEE